MANTFGERLLNERKKAGLSRAALAKAARITDKSIQNYESGSRYPNSLDIVKRLADVLDTTSVYLLGDEGNYISLGRDKSGAKGARDIREIVEEVTGLFAGGELPPDDKDALMKAFTEAYFMAKEKNKKYTSKKNRHDDDDKE